MAQVVHSNFTNTGAKDTATVAIRGLAQPLSVLHLSDSHVSLASDLAPHSDRMHTAFADGHGDFKGKMLPRELFAEQLEAAVSDDVDLIVHTGE